MSFLIQSKIFTRLFRQQQESQGVAFNIKHFLSQFTFDPAYEITKISLNNEKQFMFYYSFCDRNEHSTDCLYKGIRDSHVNDGCSYQKLRDHQYFYRRVDEIYLNVSKIPLYGIDFRKQFGTSGESSIQLAIKTLQEYDLRINITFLEGQHRLINPENIDLKLLQSLLEKKQFECWKPLIVEENKTVQLVE